MKTDNEREDIHIISNLPYIAKWIRKNEELKDSDIELIKNVWPGLFSSMRNLSIAEINSIFSRYRDNMIYSEYVKVVSSPTGQKWLITTLKRIKKEMDNRR